MQKIEKKYKRIRCPVEFTLVATDAELMTVNRKRKFRACMKILGTKISGSDDKSETSDRS